LKGINQGLSDGGTRGGKGSRKRRSNSKAPLGKSRGLRGFKEKKDWGRKKKKGRKRKTLKRVNFQKRPPKKAQGILEKKLRKMEKKR